MNNLQEQTYQGNIDPSPVALMVDVSEQAQPLNDVYVGPSDEDNSPMAQMILREYSQTEEEILAATVANTIDTKPKRSGTYFVPSDLVGYNTSNE